MNTIQILDKKFKKSIPSKEIQLMVEQIAEKLNKELKGKNVLFVVILNGAFMFASDLLKLVKFNSKVSFVKIASYSGINSTGELQKLIGLSENLKNTCVVIVEDIIDTGNTIDYIINYLKELEPLEIKIASLLHKPGSSQNKYKIDYLGFSIPNDFIVGYGLDYEGFGRNLNDIYTLTED